jgi:hypothetical protein
VHGNRRRDDGRRGAPRRQEPEDLHLRRGARVLGPCPAMRRRRGCVGECPTMILRYLPRFVTLWGMTTGVASIYNAKQTGATYFCYPQKKSYFCWMLQTLASHIALVR